MSITILIAIACATSGAVLVAAGARQRHAAASAATNYLASLEDPDDLDDEFTRRLREPFISRAATSLRGTVVPLLRRFTPTGLLAKTRHDLVVAGLAEKVAPEELVSAQVVLGCVGFLAAMALLIALHLSSGVSVLALALLPTVGVLIPAVLVKRRAAERSLAIFKDLPDCLDLLAISVEAGVGFEAALDVVCRNFDSALAEEFRRTLREMELGQSRHDALINLRNRTDVPELSTFILALTQADALGMPVGRVLHTQAIEMRNRRRQWARERAAKLPVKILFPLVLFIFPAVLVVILGPAAASIVQGFGAS